MKRALVAVGLFAALTGLGRPVESAGAVPEERYEVELGYEVEVYLLDAAGKKVDFFVTKKKPSLLPLLARRRLVVRENTPTRVRLGSHAGSDWSVDVKVRRSGRKIDVDFEVESRAETRDANNESLGPSLDQMSSSVRLKVGEVSEWRTNGAGEGAGPCIVGIRVGR